MRRSDGAAAALDIAYRQAGDGDLPFLAQVYGSTRTEELAATGWPDETKRAFLAHQFDAQHAHYRAHYPRAEWLVIVQGGEDVGRLYVEEWDDQIRIVDIALLPDARGGGIGAAILADLARESEAKAKPLTIHVEKNNPARRLYLRLGFAPKSDHSVYELMERPVRGVPAG
ncbi:MAG: N-acetyltransferase [Alphaproteobacteria bacterium]|nr:N-acetyltransferase [Alphaproteobacteria bacterium]